MVIFHLPCHECCQLTKIDLFFFYYKYVDVQFMNSRELKAQLREIAPMNNESAKLFCPNGPSSNVSPLMENKCGDRMATPSVFGRTNDIVGNSIPGFTGGKYGGVGDSSSLTAEAGGFPKY